MLRLIAICALCLLTLTAPPARAQSLLRDADIEHGLSQIAAPVLRAAGLSRVRVRLIDDRRMNAFVIDGTAIYIHSGLVTRLDSAAQLQAVIAHEAAHIANGHVSRRLTHASDASGAALAGVAVAVAAALAGADGKGAAGVALGAAGSARGRFLAHTRAEETAADQSSVRYMVQAGIDPVAASEVLNIFRGQEALSSSRQDAYARTHPLTRDRIRSVQALSGAAPHPAADRTADYWFARVKGKLSAFTQSPARTLSQTKGATDDVSVMRRAIALHRRPDQARAIATARALTEARPRDAFYLDLLGQILLESRQPAAAVRAYARANDLTPGNPQILGGLGRARLATKDYAGAITALERARDRDAQDMRALRDLAVAYAATGRAGEASAVTAERYAAQGRMKDAALHARRAVAALPRGSIPWRRAQDVLAAAQSLNR